MPGRTYALDHDGRSYPARLAALRADLDPRARTVTALFDLEGAPGLPFGAVLRWTPRSGIPGPGFWVPVSALVDGSRGLWTVLTLGEDARVGSEAVSVVAMRGDAAFVVGSLRDGDRIVPREPTASGPARMSASHRRSRAMDSWFYRNPRGFAIAVLVILAMGWSAFLTIGRQEDPTITNLFATVLTPYPGAEPARVEALVTEKIEAELRGVAAISEIGSVSRTGLSVINIDLAETLPKSEIEPAWT